MTFWFLFVNQGLDFLDKSGLMVGKHALKILIYELRKLLNIMLRLFSKKDIIPVFIT
jgi:hypothetical protein